MKVTDYITEEIKKKGIDKVFGYQGGGISPLIDSIGRSEGIEYIQSYHEQAAGFAADAYGRLTDKTGVCVVTNGPGVTNVISAITNAYCDYVPTVFFTGQVKTTDINTFNGTRQNAFQEVSTVELTRSITKYVNTVQNVKEIPAEIDKAFIIANEAPCGPVVIDLPLDIQNAEIEGNCNDVNDKGKYCGEDNSDNLEHETQVSTDEYTDIVKAIKASSRPVIVAGGGIREAKVYDEFRNLAKMLNIPVVRTLNGLDCVTDLDFGFSGLYGEVPSNLALFHSDLVIVLGSRLSKRQIGLRQVYAPHANFIHIDANKAELGHVVRPDIGICSDLKLFIKGLSKFISDNNLSFEFSDWWNELKTYQTEHLCDTEFNPEDELQPVTAVGLISQHLPTDAVITLDVGQNQMWCAQGLRVKQGQRVITSAGLGCMGYSLPAALGAYFSGYNHIYAFMGDGGSQMNIQELQQIKVRHIPLKLIIFNNNGLGMIQEVQWKFSEQRYFGSKIGYSAPDYKSLSAAYNLEYVAVDNNGQIKDLAELLNNDQPVIIELKLKGNPMRLLNMYDNLGVYE